MANYAMLRCGIACRALLLQRVDEVDQLADILTKPVVGAEFRRLRALVLGLHQDDGR